MRERISPVVHKNFTNPLKIHTKSFVRTKIRTKTYESGFIRKETNPFDKIRTKVEP